MRQLFSLRTTVCLALFVTLCSFTPKPEEEQFIDSLLAQMTLEEKIGQMNQLDPSYDSEAKEALIREGKVGSIFNIVGSKEVNRLQRMAVEETRLGIPMIVARDVIHGFRTIYPIPLGQAATWNPELVELAAALTADEAVSVGIRWAFSPMVDVARDPRWGRVAEGYGEDTYLTSQMSAAVVRGYQHELSFSPQDGLSAKRSVSETVYQSEGRSAGLTRPAMAACVKHFAGYAVSESGRDYNTTWIPEVQLRDVYLPPFKAAVDAGAMSLMCSFNAMNGLPSSANKHLNIDILRNEWQSDALLVSDWGSGSDLVPHGLCANKKDAALRCINARMEMDMQGNIYTDYLAELIKEGKVSEAQIDECVKSVLRIKYRLGLFENPYIPEEEPVAYTEEALSLATDIATESAILLKNNGVLPLTANSQKPIAVLITGPMADQQREQLGTWIFDGEEEHSVTPLMAFQKLTANSQQLKVLYEPGLTYSRDKNEKGIAKAVKAAKKADIILFFAGEEAILSGEARCRTDLNLPGAQTQMMEALAATGKPVVLVVMAGRPLTIGKEVEQASAVLYAFHGGTMAGPALFDLITGKAVPSGRLPMTFPKTVGQVPMYYNRLNTGRPTYGSPVLIDDIPVGAKQFSVGYSSCWLETATEPLFPFGFGLSYTTFEYGETQITNDQSQITISCRITNTGTTDAYEIPQLYVRQTSGYFARPIEELKGFQKILIPAGQTKTVTFTLTKDDLGYWHEEHDGLNSRVWFATDDVPFEFWIAPHAGCNPRKY